MKPEKHISIREFANLIKKHPNTIRRAIKSKFIKAFRIGSSAKATYRIPYSEIDRMIKMNIIADR